ncbi:MAG: hypothetical protein FJ091_05305 [Deltaproteobacteria bacterium]|nr:hypothetical protein [Deltaproteobacteria bacterium]
MAIVKWVLGIVGGVGVALGALYFAMAERVEVVLLHHHGDGGEQTVRLWVVDDAGSAWLRTGASNATWLPRVRSHPEIELERGGEERAYTAVVIDDAETVARVNQLSLEKYGWSEELLRGAGTAPTGQVAIRLDPR